MRARKAVVKALRGERGVSILIVLISVAVMGFLGAAFALMITNEARSASAAALSRRALYVAESGVQDVLFQRSKRPGDMCFPYYFYDPVNFPEPENRLDFIESLTGARSGGIYSAPAGTCDPTVSSVDPAYTAEELPCWPFNEKLYANYIHWGPDYNCHDGSDRVKCPDFEPLLWWPAEKTPGGDGHIAWKDWEESVSAVHLPLENAAQSSGARYTTGLFTLCNDDFYGISEGDPGYDKACLEAKAGGRCNQYVIRLSIVSVGEVQAGNKVVRRAVKVDLAPPALYSGVIDKYVDLTAMWTTDINGPLHINGWWNGNKWNAFLLTASASVAPVLSMFNPPELVSVSYPEDPSNPDWQPSDILGFSFSHDIVYVHLPVRIEIPRVNWAKWEDRMDDLYRTAAALYSPSKVYGLKYCKFDPAGTVVPDAVKNTQYDCGEAGQQYDCNISGGAQPDDCFEPDFPSFISTMNPSPGPYNASFGGTAVQPAVRRIHNTNKDSYQLWNKNTEQIFDLFDQFDKFPGTWVRGTEPGHIPDGGGIGDRDRSLDYKTKFMVDLDFGLGCIAGAVVAIIGGVDPLDAIIAACIGGDEIRPAFEFLGKHEFRDFVFIDGVIGIGFRTPYHTCGTEDGALGLWCVVVNPICFDVFGLEICVPPDAFKFGFPHWHVGSAMVTGEVLVNGRLYMADWVRIEGGAIYADGHIIKDQTSAYDLTLDLSDLLCWIITGGTMSFGQIFGIDISCSWLMAPINIVIGTLVPWWPEISLTNNGVLDFRVYLDINGIRMNDYVVNPGTLYTRGDFRLPTPRADAFGLVINAVLGMFIPFMQLEPAIDPIRIFNGGAIVAGGSPTGSYPAFNHGNIYLGNHSRADILTYNPDTGERSVGYVLARGGLRVWSDIIAHYGLWDFANSCSENIMDFAPDPDCAASGIFYSGGIAAGSLPTNMFGRRGGELVKNGLDYDYRVTCLNFEEPGFSASDLSCWIAGGMDIAMWKLNEFNIRGHVFAGQAGAMPGTNVRLDYDSSVRHDAVTRQYFKQLGGIPIDWIEIDSPAGLPVLDLK